MIEASKRTSQVYISLVSWKMVCIPARCGKKSTENWKRQHQSTRDGSWSPSLDRSLTPQQQRVTGANECLRVGFKCLWRPRWQHPSHGRCSSRRLCLGVRWTCAGWLWTTHVLPVAHDIKLCKNGSFSNVGEQFGKFLGRSVRIKLGIPLQCQVESGSCVSGWLCWSGMQWPTRTVRCFWWDSCVRDFRIAFLHNYTRDFVICHAWSLLRRKVFNRGEIVFGKLLTNMLTNRGSNGVWLYFWLFDTGARWQILCSRALELSTATKLRFWLLQKLVAKNEAFRGFSWANQTRISDREFIHVDCCALRGQSNANGNWGIWEDVSVSTQGASE